MVSKNFVPSVLDHEKFGQVRVVIIDGDPWFVGKDVAVALGYANPRDALAKHVPGKYKKDGVAIRDSMERTQYPTLINEQGLYRLILRSNLPKAEEFTDWTCEVLTSIRKTGMYIADPVIRSQLEEVQNALQAAEDLKSKPKLAHYYREYADIIGREVAERSAARSAIAQKTLALKRIDDDGTSMEIPHYLRRFIAEFCVFDRYAHLHATIFIKRLREEFPKSAESNRTIISDLRNIRGIDVMHDPSGILLFGIRFA